MAWSKGIIEKSGAPYFCFKDLYEKPALRLHQDPGWRPATIFCGAAAKKISGSAKRTGSKRSGRLLKSNSADSLFEPTEGVAAD
jgi:hypothetical protein